MKYSFCSALFVLLMSVDAAADGVRHITAVQPVNVSVPVGCAPRLPFQLWVEYSDGAAEWRQVRWQTARWCASRLRPMPR